MSRYSLSDCYRRSIMKRTAFSILLMLLLSACSKRVDGRLMEPLSITVSKSQAVVGEQVTVTLTGGFVNLGDVPSPDLIVYDFRLGACFGRTADQPVQTRGGLCSLKDSPLLPYIVIAEGQSYRRAFGKQVIKSGEEVVLKHTFSFTSTEPGPVRLMAVSQREAEGLPGTGVENSLDVEVQFK